MLEHLIVADSQRYACYPEVTKDVAPWHQLPGEAAFSVRSSSEAGPVDAPGILPQCGSVPECR